MSLTAVSKGSEHGHGHKTLQPPLPEQEQGPENRAPLTTPTDSAHLMILTQTRGRLVFRAGTSALLNSYEKRERNGLIN